MNWKFGSSSREAAFQVQSPEFKPQSLTHPPTPKKTPQQNNPALSKKGEGRDRKEKVKTPVPLDCLLVQPKQAALPVVSESALTRPT
jgi:hypothetical protein